MQPISSINNFKINFRHNFRVSWYLIVAMYKDNSESNLKIFSEIIITVARFGLLIWLYYYLFKYEGDTIMGQTYQTIVWSMFFYFSFMNINPRYISRGIQQDVKTGNIENIFAKPVNYLMYKISQYFGSRVNAFLVNTVLGIILLYFYVGIPKSILTINFLLTFPLTFVFCFLLSFLMYSSLGLLSFWLEDVAPIQWLVDKFAMILGGSFLPVAFFPPFMKNLAIWSPFGASQFVTHTVYATWTTDYLKLLGIQIGWIIFFGISTYYIFKRALKNASVNGG